MQVDLILESIHRDTHADPVDNEARAYFVERLREADEDGSRIYRASQGMTASYEGPLATVADLVPGKRYRLTVEAVDGQA